MRQINLLTAVLAALILVGAGCLNVSQTTNVVMPAQSANSDSALTPREYNLNREPQAVANDMPATASPSLMDNQPTQKTYRFPGILSKEDIHGKQVRLQTGKGEIVFDLYDDMAPKTVSNFVYLANQGYFDSLTFHRVVPGFVIQGGDPRGDGTGGPGYKFEDEKVTLDYEAGIVAMANSGPNTNGSQFFITTAATPWLNGKHTVFGEVIEGYEVVDAIQKAPRNSSDKPKEEQKIESISVEE